MNRFAIVIERWWYSFFWINNTCTDTDKSYAWRADCARRLMSCIMNFFESRDFLTNILNIFKNLINDIFNIWRDDLFSYSLHSLNEGFVLSFVNNIIFSYIFNFFSQKDCLTAAVFLADHRGLFNHILNIFRRICLLSIILYSISRRNFWI